MDVWTYFASILPHFLTSKPESCYRIRYDGPRQEGPRRRPLPHAPYASCISLIDSVMPATASFASLKSIFVLSA